MPYIMITFTIIMLDQFTKWLLSDLLSICEPGRCESIEILPVFQFTLLHNTGAAFSFLHDAGGWQRWFLVTLSTLVSLLIARWLYKIYTTQKLLAYGLTLILGGAMGNLIDRVLAGYVVDFIVVHWEHHYFPAFNVADSAITIGAGLLILETFISPDGTKTAKVKND